MQNRMKTHTLTDEQTDALLMKAQVGRIATVSPEGYPYVVPVHFVYGGGKIHAHGLPKGQKLEYIARDPRVGFEVDEMSGLLCNGVEVACDVNTEFSSVIILGSAAVLTSTAEKREVLDRIVTKYTPQFSGRQLPDSMVSSTAVIEISILRRTGKYFR